MNQLIKGIQFDDVIILNTLKTFNCQYLGNETNYAAKRGCPGSPHIVQYLFDYFLFGNVSAANLAYVLLIWYVKIWHLFLYQIVSLFIHKQGCQ